MKKKILFSLLTLSCSTIVLAGCGDDHTHTFDTANWSWNETQHWHQATCGHDLAIDLGVHSDANQDKICDICSYNFENPTPSPTPTPDPGPTPTPTPTPDPSVGDYYKDIDPDSSNLLSNLRELNKTKQKSKIGYDSLKYAYKYTDIDPNGSGKIVGFYDNKLVGPNWDSGKTWNREHVWPKSLGGDLVEGDAHMARPTWTDSNSDRGNKYYAEYNAYDPAELGIKNYRGIAARIIFYCVVAHASLKLVDATSGGGNQMGKLSDLLKWNLEYPPTTSETAALELKVEQQRNNVIQSKYQGNRNPFIDHPEYACKIWGTTNSATKKICGIN